MLFTGLMFFFQEMANPVICKVFAVQNLENLTK